MPNPEFVESALIYLASIALARVILDPHAAVLGKFVRQAPKEVAGDNAAQDLMRQSQAAGASQTTAAVAMRLLQVTNDPALQNLELGQKSANSVVSQLRSLAWGLVGSRVENEELSLRQRVDRILADRLSPGKPLMAEYLHKLSAPVRDRLNLLVSITLARENARSLVLKGVAVPRLKQVDEAAFSNIEKEQLDKMRGDYRTLFKKNEESLVAADGAPERLLQLRASMKARGMDLVQSRGFCVGSLAQLDCVEENKDLYEDGGPYLQDPRFDSLLPLSLIDAELRSLTATTLIGVVAAFESAAKPGQAKAASLSTARKILEELVETASDRRPSFLDSYDTSGKTTGADAKRLPVDLFVAETGTQDRPDLCREAIGSGTMPSLGLGTEELKQAHEQAERFISPGGASAGGLKWTCELLARLAEQAPKELE